MNDQPVHSSGLQELKSMFDDVSNASGIMDNVLYACPYDSPFYDEISQIQDDLDTLYRKMDKACSEE